MDINHQVFDYTIPFNCYDIKFPVLIKYLYVNDLVLLFKQILLSCLTSDISSEAVWSLTSQNL